MTTKPPLVISSLDAERLEQLLGTLRDRDVQVREALEAELERAEIVDPHEVPPSVVTMNSRVRFRISGSDETFCLRLVYPRDVDPAGGTVSILAPVGGALLGLTQGDEIDWPKPGGGQLRVRIEEVAYQPEREGEYHR